MLNTNNPDYSLRDKRLNYEFHRNTNISSMTFSKASLIVFVSVALCTSGVRLHLPVLYHSGYQDIELELKSPSELSYEPPTPLRQDDFFNEDGRLNFPTSAPVRPSELSLPSNSGPASADAKPPTVIEEDTSIRGRGSFGQEDGLTEDDLRESAVSSKQHDIEATSKEQDVFPSSPVREEAQHEPTLCSSARGGPGEGSLSGFDEEDEELTQEKIKVLLENIKLEEGLEDVEMTEERLQEILSQVQQAEIHMSSISGSQGETSGAMVTASGQGLGTDTQGQR